MEREDLDDELSEVRETFALRYALVLRIFDYYCAASTHTTKAAFAMTENLFNRFVYETGVADDRTLRRDECSKIFIVCNLETDGATAATAKANDARSLMRYEFMEAIIRMAVSRYSGENPDVSDNVAQLLDEVVEAIARWVAAGPVLYALMSVNEYITHRWYQHEEFNRDHSFQRLCQRIKRWPRRTIARIHHNS